MGGSRRVSFPGAVCVARLCHLTGFALRWWSFPSALWIPKVLFRGANIPRSHRYLQRSLPFTCLFCLGGCGLIIDHSNCSSEKQDCSLLVVQSDLRLGFLFPSLLLTLVLSCLHTCCLRVWNISEFQASGSSCTIALQGWCWWQHPLLCPRSPYFFHLFSSI